MKSQQIEYQGRKYWYVLSILDVFYRYHWLAPLNSKHTTKIAIELKEIYDVHGTPENLPSDRGKEFYGAVKTYCEKKKVKMTQKLGLPPEISRQSRKIPQNTK